MLTKSADCTVHNLSFFTDLGKPRKAPHLAFPRFRVRQKSTEAYFTISTESGASTMLQTPGWPSRSEVGPFDLCACATVHMLCKTWWCAPCQEPYARLSVQELKACQTATGTSCWLCLVEWIGPYDFGACELLFTSRKLCRVEASECYSSSSIIDGEELSATVRSGLRGCHHP